MKGLHPDVEPSGNGTSVDDGRRQHTPVEAGAAGLTVRARTQTGQEALEAVDGREAVLGIVEGQELAVHGTPPGTWLLNKTGIETDNRERSEKRRKWA